MILTLDFFLQLIYAVSLTSIALKIIQKLRQRNTILGLDLTPFRYKTIRFKIKDGNKIQIGDKTEEIYADSIIEEEKPFYKFWRLPKRLILFNGITQKVMRWKKPLGRKPKNISEEDFKKLEMFQRWTLKEIKAYNKKIVEKYSGEKTRKEALLPLITFMVLFFLCLLVYLGFHNIGAL